MGLPSIPPCAGVFVSGRPHPPLLNASNTFLSHLCMLSKWARYVAWFRIKRHDHQVCNYFGRAEGRKTIPKGIILKSISLICIIFYLSSLALGWLLLFSAGNYECRSIWDVIICCLHHLPSLLRIILVWQGLWICSGCVLIPTSVHQRYDTVRWLSSFQSRPAVLPSVAWL